MALEKNIVLLFYTAAAFIITTNGQAPYFAIGPTVYTDPDLELPISIFGRGGTGPEAALACFLDNPSESTWYYPDGSAVAISNEYPPTGTFIYVRRATAITLHRDPAAFSPTGRYCCGLSTVPVEERLCVNIVLCSLLTIPNNGIITYSDETRGMGTVATYSCNLGYVLMGDITRTCTSAKTWSGMDASCQIAAAVCPLLLTPNNGVINFNPRNSTLVKDTIATHSCNDGYLLIGESIRTCQSDRTWSNTAPYCIALCAPLPTTSNGDVKYFNLRNLSLVENFTIATYSCIDGYFLIGERIRTCQSNRTWSSTAPYCADSAMIQLKFAPTEHCIQWNENKAWLTSLHMRGAIQEAILSEGNITIPLEHIEEGFFSCRTSHDQTTYRTKIIGIETAGAIEIASFVQKWVESGATVRVQWYIVDIDKNCPVSISSMSEPECGQDPGIQRCVDICVARGRQ